MTSRATRIERLRNIRERELSELVQHLTAARTRHSAAQNDAVLATRRLEEARDAQRKLLTTGGNGLDFSQAEEWVYHQEVQREIALNAVRRADREVQRRQHDVRLGHRRLEQLKLLEQRLAARAQSELRRKEQKQEDEIASRIAYKGTR